MSGTTTSYSSPVDFRIGQLTPDGVPDSTRVAFDELYAMARQTTSTFVNFCGIGPRTYGQWSALAGTSSTLLSGNLNRLYVVASEAITFGAAISLWNNAGTLNVRNANATDNTKPARGFCTTSGGIAIGAAGEVQIHSGVASIGGLTIGASYYLSTTSGLVAAGPAVAAGNIEQYVGFAVTATSLAFNVGNWLQH